MAPGAPRGREPREPVRSPVPRPPHRCALVATDGSRTMAGPPRILVVEDERLVAHDLQRHLQRLGFTVCGIATSGREAIALAAQTHPALILMDIVLDGPMDGIEAAAQIRAHAAIPVIYL